MNQRPAAEARGLMGSEPKVTQVGMRTRKGHFRRVDVFAFAKALRENEIAKAAEVLEKFAPKPKKLVRSCLWPQAHGVCQRSCPPISCGVSDFRGADFGFGVEPDGSGGLPVAGFA